MSTPAPDYDELADLMLNLRVMRQPEELHGYIAGVLVAGLRPDASSWLQICQDYLEITELPASDAAPLQALAETTAAQLASEDMDFQLLQPDDVFELYSRIAALGGWCEGFLGGFAFAGKRVQELHGEREYSAETSEALSDILAIANIGVEGDEDSESESDLFEVSEFVRVAALSLYMENDGDQAAADPAEPPPTLH